MNYDKKRNAVCISVKELCCAATRHGDLSSRGIDMQRLHEGGKIHRKLQALRGDNYHSEVVLTNTCRYNDVTYFVSGCADGIITDGDGYIVEEIKTVSGSSYTGVRNADLCQLKCYGYFLANQKQLSMISLRLSYYEIGNDKETHYDRVFSYDELRAFFISLLGKVSRYGELMRDRAERILPCAKDAVFPYPELRDCQSELMKECYNDLKQGDRLFAEAPTGIGKTVSTLYPAVRVLGLGKFDKIFYLTAKASIRREVSGTCELIRAAGTDIRSIVLSAKEQTCLCPSDGMGHYCKTECCKFAIGYYDRIEEAVFSLINEKYTYTREDIIKTAQTYSVCPYELSLDLFELCDIIICDYNYVFSPTTCLKRYFDPILRTKKLQYCFLVDEAHNLPGRARDMYSAKIRTSDVLSAITGLSYTDPETGEVTAADGELAKAISGVECELRRLELLCEGEMSETEDGKRFGFALSSELFSELIDVAERFKKTAIVWLKANSDSECFDCVDKLLSSVYEYLTVAEYFDKSFASFVNVNGDETEVGIFCLDPSEIMDSLLDRAYSAVLFSATLTPSDYYADVLGNSQKNVIASYPSPFPEKNFRVVIADYISTRFEGREKSVKQIATSIAATVSAKAGNYIVYFPSYKYMEDVYKNFRMRFPKVKVLMQKRNMAATDRDSFLDFFKADEGKLRIGFCVLGGSFSEGVNLPGSRLIGSIVVGVGLPGISNEGNIIKAYYDEKNGMGYEYAYTYPGFNKVMQAVGRVIRTETDKGIAVLIDDRYATPAYSYMYPKCWGKIIIAGNPSSLAKTIKDFWN